MVSVRICECGKEFEHKRKDKFYCSKRCSYKFRLGKSFDDVIRHHKYISNYGISLDDYNKLFILQEGCCVICKRHQSLFKMKLSVDHDHSTGRIRGLLCHKCNRGLGLFNDNPKIIASALEYVS